MSADPLINPPNRRTFRAMTENIRSDSAIILEHRQRVLVNENIARVE